MSEQKNKSVLIIDDDPYIVQMIDMLLKLKGYLTLTASNGIEAIKSVYSNIPDLVLLDVMMPKMNGYQVLRLIKSDPNLRNIPVLMLTAKVQEEDRTRGLMSGADYYLTKPFEMVTLISKIEELILTKRELSYQVQKRDIEIIEILSKANDLLDRRIYELEILGKVLETMATAIDLDQILYEIASGIKSVLGFNRIWIALVNEDENALEGRVCLGHIVESDFVFAKIPLDSKSNQPSVKAILNKTHLNITDLEHDLSMPKEQLLGTRSSAFLDVPIIVHGKALGVIRVDNFQTGDVIREDDIKELIKFVNQAGLAIETAQIKSALTQEKIDFELTITNISSGIVVIDADKRIIIYNAYMEKLLGYERELFLGKPLHAWTDLVDIVPLETSVDAVLGGLRNIEEELQAVSKSETVPIHLSIKATLLTSGEKHRGVVIGINDITKLTRQTNELEQKNDNFKLLFHIAQQITSRLTLNELLDQITHQTSYVFKEEDFCSILIYDRQDDMLRLVNSSVKDRQTFTDKLIIKPSVKSITTEVFNTGKGLYVNSVQEDSRFFGDPDIYAEMCMPVKEDKRIVGVFDIQRRAKKPFTEDDFHVFESIGSLVSIAYTNASLYEEKTLLSVTDELTGISNRRQLNELLKKEFIRSRRFGKFFSLIMIDIDNFKHYNDKHGHLFGDQVLRSVAQILMNASRGEIDCVARFGGEEFMIVLPETSKPDALKSAERIRRLVEQFTFPYGDEQPLGYLSISAGVSSYPDDASSLESMLESVDTALYKAKELGKNRVVDASSLNEEGEKG